MGVLRWLVKWVFRGLVVVAIALAAPIGYVETMCRGTPATGDFASGLAVEHHRAEARTFMTYPEWHIVHAYDDYAQVIATGDPHDYGYWQAITGFWSSLCALNETAAQHGGADGATKQMVYVIGASFSLELGLKAAYEETLGRIATLLRGDDRTVLDEISATQARDYAQFLQQVPWYKWDFDADAAALKSNATSAFRDWERATALGLEYGAKSAYAGVIAGAVASTGADALTLRMVVTDVDTAQLNAIPDISVISETDAGIEIETPRYRALTHILAALADTGAQFVDIAGNDDILFTATGARADHACALHSFARQGYGDHRHLIATKVSLLAQDLRALPAQGLQLEHIHDY